MNEDPKYFRIGLFVIGGALLLAATLITFGAGKIFQQRLYFETYLSSSVAGIDRGSSVRFRGVSIGKVTDVTFVFNEYPDENRSGVYNYVMLIMEVTEAVFPQMFTTPDLEEQVHRAVSGGLRARIEPQGITGLNYVELDFLNPQEFPALQVDWEPKNLYIPSAPGQLAGILDSVNKIMREMENFHIGELESSLRTLLDNMNSAVTEANIGKLSEDIQNFSNQSTLLVEELKKVLADANVPALSAGLQRSLDSVTDAVSDLQRILANIEPSTRLNSDDINATLANLRIISDNLRDMSSELRANPSRLIFGRPPAKAGVFDHLRPSEKEEEVDPAPASTPPQNLRPTRR